ncbi:pathogenesis-related protein 1A-like [Magnolia sinica]|uniref:pathogenesis-related protein 1A-like n=1 Tax=Magnolia sinica TaxID=86752 RepID=UPI00265830A2|nr:pathogenesis-related protein 1A-like [Magnolia sinica]
MELLSRALALIYVMGLAMAHVGQAQSSPKEFVALHNAVRAEVGVGPMTWDTTVASYAESYAKERAADCELVHSGGPYGENIYWGIGAGYDDARAAMKNWATEKQYYDHENNKCMSGQECRHYTQIVWRKSVHLGCASVTCNDGKTFITCNYDPPGNYIGESPY